MNTTIPAAIHGTKTVEGVTLTKTGAGRYLIMDGETVVAEIIRNEGGPGWWLLCDTSEELRRSLTACVRTAKLLGLVGA